jgi:hypothetical protein
MWSNHLDINLKPITMKYDVNYSSFVRVEGMLLMIVYCILLGYFSKHGEMPLFLFLAIVLGIWLVLALFYAPRAIELADDKIIVRRLFATKNISFSDIESVRYCPVTKDERRIFGSAGFFGYWGWYKEKNVGKYFAYYGNSSECFLVTMRSGRKYMLGCESTQDVVDYIQQRIA